MATIKHTVKHATPEDLPPELQLLVFGHISSAADLRCYLYASPRAAATFHANKRQALVNLLRSLLTKQRLTHEAIVTGLKIHLHEIDRKATDEAMKEVDSTSHEIENLDESALQTLYWLCLRHEPFVEDVFSKGWRKTQPGGHIMDTMRVLWDDCRISSPVEHGSFTSFVETFPKRFLSALFTLELIIRAEGSRFDEDDCSVTKGCGSGGACRSGPGFGLHTINAALGIQPSNNEVKMNTRLFCVILNEQMRGAILHLYKLRADPRLLGRLFTHGDGKLLPNERRAAMARYPDLVRTCLRRGGSTLRYDRYFKDDTRRWAEPELMNIDSLRRLIDAFEGFLQQAARTWAAQNQHGWDLTGWRWKYFDPMGCIFWSWSLGGPIGAYIMTLEMAELQVYIYKATSRGDARAAEALALIRAILASAKSAQESLGST